MAGASATATAAAWANRLLAPMTKVSKVYFGFRRAASTSIASFSAIRVRTRRPPRPIPVLNGEVSSASSASASSSSVSVAVSGGVTLVSSVSRSRPTEGSTVTASRICLPSWSDERVVTCSRTRVSTTSLV